MADPARRWYLGLAVLAVSASACAGVAARWALVLPPPPPVPAFQPPAAPPVVTTGPDISVDPRAWQVVLWQPLRDAPPVEKDVAPPTPPRATVFSILERGGERIAAIDVDNAGLVYLRASERHGDLRVVRIEGDTVIVDHQGHEFRLELGR